MRPAPLPENEGQRLETLRGYDILDTLPEQAYDDITLVASRICNTPIAAVSLVDTDRQWFKSTVGLAASETPRDIAFCAHAILNPSEILEVPDAMADERFAGNPLVLEDPRIRFYAGAPLIAPDGMPLGSLCVIDKSPRALSEEQRDTLRALARQVVSQLELRSHVGQLERQKQEIEISRLEQLELKDRLLRHVSHELRTPLAAQHQFLSLVIDEVGDRDEQRQYLELAFKSTHQLKGMISDLLEVARAQTGKLRVDPRLLCLSSLVADVAETAREAVSTSGISLHVETTPGLPRVLADESRTRQVLQNLIENARKFTSEGGTIVISARLATEEPGFVHCSVSDSGCGIAEENLGAIFEQFHQEPNQHASSREGLGIGLAICQSLVMRMGGRISVESKLGAGSTFHFTLPVFDLGTLVRQALSNAQEPARACDGLALVRVTPKQLDATRHPPREAQQRRLRHLLEGLLFYPVSDRLLPALDEPAGCPAEHLLVPLDPGDLPALMRRLHENLNLDPQIRLWKQRVEIEGVWLPAGAASETAALESEIEALIRSSHWEGEKSHGEEQDPDRR